jgi:hypothetical protein
MFEDLLQRLFRRWRRYFVSTILLTIYLSGWNLRGIGHSTIWWIHLLTITTMILLYVDRRVLHQELPPSKNTEIRVTQETGQYEHKHDTAGYSSRVLTGK